MERQGRCRPGRRPGRPGTRGRRAWRPGLVGALVVLGFVAGRSLPGHAGQGMPAPAPKVTLAVLPFTGPAAQDGYGLLLAEALLEAFGQVRAIRLVRVPQLEAAGTRVGLRVGEPWSTEALRAVARELQVQGLITGTYTREDHGITVQARFVEPADPEGLESGEAISTPARAYLRAPQRIAAAAVARFQVRVTTAEAARVRHVLGDDAVPLELYMRYAQARWAQGRGTRADHEHAIALLTTVLETAPAFAPAHLAMGNSWLALDDPWNAWSAFRAALLLDARLPDAHKRLGDVLLALPTRQYEPAQRAYEAALELAPDDVEAWVGLAGVRQARGQTEAAIGAYEQAVALDPANAPSHVGLGQIYAAEKTLYYDAVAELRQAIALDPHLVAAHLALGDLYAEKGLYPEAAERYRALLALDPRHPGAAWGLAEALEHYDVPAAIAQWEQYLRLTATLPAEQGWAGLAHKHVEKLRRGGAPAAR